MFDENNKTICFKQEAEIRQRNKQPHINYDGKLSVSEDIQQKHSTTEDMNQMNNKSTQESNSTINMNMSTPTMTKKTDVSSNTITNTPNRREPDGTPNLSLKTASQLLSDLENQCDYSTAGGRQKNQVSQLLRLQIKSFHDLDEVSKRHLITNAKYAKQVLGQFGTEYDLRSNITTQTSESQFFQTQGLWPLCGLCVLNNSLQKEVFCYKELCEIADELWMMQILDQQIPLSNELQALRGKYGDFSFDILIEAAKRNNISFINMRQNVFYSSTSDLREIKVNLSTHFSARDIIPSVIMRLGTQEHYICIRRIDNMFAVFDSSKSNIIIWSEDEVIENIMQEIQFPMCAVYGLRNIATDTSSTPKKQTQQIDEPRTGSVICTLRTILNSTITVLDDHLLPLKENQHCNNTVIDFVSECLMRVNNTVYIPETVLSACMSSRKTYNICMERYSSSETCLIPIHDVERNHWYLVILDVPQKRMSIYDPLPLDDAYHANIKIRLESYFPDINTYNLVTVVEYGSFTQVDSWSCGYHVILMMIFHACPGRIISSLSLLEFRMS